ncbi:MAG: PaaI family thioesterase [Halolamina sp.]
MAEDLPPLPEGAEGFVRYAIEEQHGYLSWLGTEVGAVERGRIELTVPFDEKLTNPASRPTIHGGVAATLVDTAGGLALRLAAEDPLAVDVATVSLNVNYLRRATGDLHATADVIRAGSTIGVSRVDVTSTVPTDSDGDRDWGVEAGEEQLVATGQPSYRLFR